MRSHFFNSYLRIFLFFVSIVSRGHRIVAIMAAFQAAERGPIPLARSTAKLKNHGYPCRDF